MEDARTAGSNSQTPPQGRWCIFKCIWDEHKALRFIVYIVSPVQSIKFTIHDFQKIKSWLQSEDGKKTSWWHRDFFLYQPTIILNWPATFGASVSVSNSIYSPHYCRSADHRLFPRLGPLRPPCARQQDLLHLLHLRPWATWVTTSYKNNLLFWCCFIFVEIRVNNQPFKPLFELLLNQSFQFLPLMFIFLRVIRPWQNFIVGQCP